MRTLLTAILVTCSTLSMAVMEEGKFEGKGVWKSPESAKGTFTETLTISKAEGGLQAVSHTTVYQDEKIIHEDKMTALYVMKGNGFFDIQVEKNVIGNGYCFERVCHLDYSKEQEHAEETLHIAKGGVIHKIGSARGETKGVKWAVAWKGALRHKKD